MPYSYPKYKEEIKQHIIEAFPADMKILDVGAGGGCYAHLLREKFTHIDALEIYEPYIEQFELRKFYREVIIGDILDFDISGYDYIIMGDVLEHIDFVSAINLIGRIKSMEKKCLVAVPYLYHQGSFEGNDAEIHLQPDLTHEVFMMRYPSMNCMWRDEQYGYYKNY